ncbi:SufS family cysteine desulfurase [Candidatus Woesearchaeota archaeon]|nr:SufS family cysteine desulfurase [Candidatus Woesearchaeota archaeon]
MKLTNQKAKELKKDFPLLQKKERGKELVYIDNAATTQKPKAVIDAVCRYYLAENANIHRGLYKISEIATLHWEKAHASVASFIHADPEEIIFTRNATEGINLVSYCLPALFRMRKEIVVTALEHHANLVPWQECAKRHGLILKVIAMKPDFTLDYKDAQKKITEQTALVAMNHISNALGTKNDVQYLISLAKKNGAFTLVDAAQSAPHTPINVRKMGCDFLAFSSHKMLGPTGLGVLYGRKELLAQMPPFMTGGDMIRTVSYQDATWNDLPMKFEAGTPHIAGAIGFAEAIKYLQEVGMETIEAWEGELLSYALKEFQKIKGVTVYSTGPEKSAGILSFNIKGVHAHDVASILGAEGICIRGGHHCAMPLMGALGIAGTCRASFYLYTTYEDVDRLVAAVKKVKSIFGIEKR